MHSQTGLRAQRGGLAPAFASRRPSRIVTVRAEAAPRENGRRDVLLSGGALLSAALLAGPAVADEKRLLSVELLGSFQRNDQKKAFRQRAEAALREVLTAEDAPQAVRLAFNDAATYDLATKKGGFDGSVVLSSEEAGRPENKDLAPLVAKLTAAKKVIDGAAEPGQSPISWADLVYLAGKVATTLEWKRIKVARSPSKDDGELIASAFAPDWPVILGRVDSAEAGPAVSVPGPGASAEEVRTFLLGLGAKPDAGSGPFTPKAPFWERPGFLIWTAAQPDPAAAEAFLASSSDTYRDILKDYNISRATVTRTNYEVDFLNTYNKLSLLGAKLDPLAYLHPELLPSIKF